MLFPIPRKADFLRLFDLSQLNVQSIASQGIQADLSLLQMLESGKQTSPFSAEDTAHLQQVSDTYLQNHPLGFLAKSSPIIAQSMVQDALRRDVVKRMGAYNFANGHFKNLDATIDSLHQKSSDEFAPAVQATFNAIHREILMNTAKDMSDKARSVRDDLWGTSAHDERSMQHQFEYSAKQLDKAIALFDQGQTEAALTLYADVMGETDGYAAWFGRALRTSEQYKFAAHIGIAMAAGAAAYFTGGASLALMGGAEASLGAHVTSMLIGGAGMTVTSRSLNAAVFNKTFFIPGTTLDKAVDFSGELLHNTALMGVLRLGNIAGASIPMMEGEPIVAATINAARGFAIELGSFTSFNMVSSISHEFDDRLPSIDDVLSREALIDNAAFILGLRIGHLGLNTATAAMKTAGRVIEPRLNTPQATRLLLAPVSIMSGIPGGGRISDPTPSGSLSALLRTRGIKSAAIEIYNRRPYKFWGIMNLLDLDVPPALVAYRILRLQVDDYSRALMQEFQSLRNEPAVKDALAQIRTQGMRVYLASTGVPMSSDKSRSGAELMDRLAIAFTQMQGYIDRYSAAATAAGHLQGMEYEGMTHFGKYEEVVWPSDRVPIFHDNTATLSARDRMAIILQKDLTKKGYDVSFVTGKTYFGYPSIPTVFPIIYEQYKVGAAEAKVEILTGTGAIIVTVIPSDPSLTKTEFVKDAASVFESTVHKKAADMIVEALHLNADVDPPKTIAALQKEGSVFERRYLIQAKSVDSDTLKIWVTINNDGTSTLQPINGILKNKSGEYVAGPITINASNYEAVYAWLLEHAASNPKFAKKIDKYGGVLIDGFGEVTLTDEAPPYKEIVSPKLMKHNFSTWLDVLESLQEMGITGTTPYNLVGTHMHANLPLILPSTGMHFTIQPILGLLRGFIKDEDMLYAAIPSHDNRLGFIQPMPTWLRNRLLDPSYVTDPTDRRQILRVAADLAHDVKKYNALNLSNHVSSLLAAMIEKGLLRNGESSEISSQWGGEDYKIRIESNDIIRDFFCATYSIRMTEDSLVIIDRYISNMWSASNALNYFNNRLLDLYERGELEKLQIGEGFQKRLELNGDEYQLVFTRTNVDTLTVEIKKLIHLIRVAKDLRKTTAELRIIDAVFDRDTGSFLMDFFYAWSWWYGSGQFLPSTSALASPH